MQLALLYHKVFGHLEKFFAARIFSKIGVTVVVLTRQDSTHAVLMPCKRTTTITAVLAEKRTWVPGGGFRGGPIQQRKHKGKLKDTEGTGAFTVHRHLLRLPRRAGLESDGQCAAPPASGAGEAARGLRPPGEGPPPGLEPPVEIPKSKGLPSAHAGNNS